MKELDKLIKKSEGRSVNKNMRDLLNLFDSTIVPDPDKYYTFIYKAKTPGIVYDAHPVVKVGAIFKWGFMVLTFTGVKLVSIPGLRLFLTFISFLAKKS